MFGIIVCSGCNRLRIIDLSDDRTKCPYCGTESVTKKKKICFSDEDQNVVRDALNRLSGAPVDEKKKMDETIDPLSTLAYKVEHTTDVMGKMELIANGLTEIKGTFTVDDVEELIPGQGEKYVKIMLAECIIYEVGYGKYSV